MAVYEVSKGHYGYNFMHKGIRCCRSFKGKTKDEVATLEMEHRLSLIKGTSIPTATATSIYYWEDAVRDFKVYAEAHYTRPTECMYIIDSFGQIVSGMNIKDIKQQHLEKYITNRLGKVKASTINREMNNIRKVFSLAFDNGFLDKNPCNKVKNLRIVNPEERFLSKYEEPILLDKCNDVLKWIVQTAIYTGLRQNELLNLKWVDINLNEKYLLARETKNNTVREVPICDKLINVFKSIPRISEYVFTNPRTMMPYKDVYSSFSRAVKRAKIQHITFHQLRHTTASRLNELGVDIVTIQEILGHASINTTRKYTHNTRASKVNAMKLLGG